MSKKKRINTAAGIPQWFRDMPYDDVNDFLIWGRVIENRIQIQRDVESIERDRALTSKDVNEVIERLTMSITGTDGFEMSTKTSAMHDLRAIDVPTLKSLIAPSEVRRYQQECKNVMKRFGHTPTSAAQLVSDIFWDDEYFSQSINDLLQDQVSEDLADPRRYYLSVDLTHDLDTLEADFKSWVREKRKLYFDKNRSILKKDALSPGDLMKWHEYRVLQVFDIDLWQRIANVKITDWVLADFLWPPDDVTKSMVGSSLDRLRNHTRKSRVPAVISPSTCWKIQKAILPPEFEEGSFYT